jgi:signal transduction histidine kinase
VLYLTAAHRRRLVWVPLALPFLANAVVPLGHQRGPWPSLALLALVAGALLLGDADRQRRQVVAERDASRRAMVVSLRERAAMEERARIARELHDIVAHSLSMIAIQADTTRLTTEGLPEEGRGRVAAIGDTARGALTEMRRLLGVLRTDAGALVEHEPQPRLDRLDELVDAARSAGGRVQLTISGQVRPVPPGVDLSAYRIVQEALTNALRHAAGAAVEVRLGYEPDRLRIQVCDDGPGRREGHEGHGLLGMRERVALLGGTLHVGPGAVGGGVTVEADLPLPEAT